MKKLSRVLWGVVLIVFGLLLALNAFDVVDLNAVSFDGWWTLFIIIPSVVGLFTEHRKFGNIITLCVGVVLLLACQQVIEWDVLFSLAVPVLIVLCGLRLVFDRKRPDETDLSLPATETATLPNGTAIFSGQDINFGGETFDGVQLTAIFGGIECNLKQAVIEKDCVIYATTIFGGADILLPDTVNVKVRSRSLFGGVSDKTANNSPDNHITIYVEATCLFGGVDLK